MTEIINYDLCAKCGGFCCKYYFRIATGKDQVKRINTDFLETVCVESKEVGEDIFYVMNSRCPHLTDIGCNLGDDRPILCKQFPHGEPDTKGWDQYCLILQDMIKKGKLKPKKKRKGITWS